jgi:flagellar hook-length control protein FliK
MRQIKMAVGEMAAGVMNIAAAATGRSGTEFQKVIGQMQGEEVADVSKSQPQATANENKTKAGLEVLKSKLSGKKTIKEVNGEIMPDEEVLAVMQSLTADIKAMLMESLQVSGGELEEAMKAMGIKDADLLNVGVLSELVAKLGGEEDPMAALMDQGFSDQLRQILEETGKMKQEVMASLPVEEDTALQVLQGHPLSDSSGELDQYFDETHNSGPQLSGQMGQMNAIFTNIQEAVGAVVEDVLPEQVMRQIVDKIQVSVTVDTATFEMQLNPEHLGRVDLSIQSRDGVVTAQLAAENHSVKEILESQIAVLKENLQNQGVKVDAVEVTIASHEFEQNLDQRGGNADQEPERNRPFRLMDEDGMEEGLTIGDIIADQMMAASGNQINYKV